MFARRPRDHCLLICATERIAISISESAASQVRSHRISVDQANTALVGAGDPYQMEFSVGTGKMFAPIVFADLGRMPTRASLDYRTHRLASPPINFDFPIHFDFPVTLHARPYPEHLCRLVSQNRELSNRPIPMRSRGAWLANG
jgi:hypothetical protein